MKCSLDIRYRRVDIDGIPELITQRENARREFPNDSDADSRFPIYDIRKRAQNRTANANRNMLCLFWIQQQLWQTSVLEHEKSGNFL